MLVMTVGTHDMARHDNGVLTRLVYPVRGNDRMCAELKELGLEIVCAYAAVVTIETNITFH